MTAKLTWKGPAVVASLEEAVARRILAAAVLFVTEHQRRLNRSNPSPHHAPAAPGEYPRKRTGMLQAGVGYRPTSLGEVIRTRRVELGLGQSSRHGLFLEAKGWLGFSRTLDDLRPRIEQILGTGSATA